MFSKVSEAEITQAIMERYSKEFKEFIKSDVIIVGAGPSGLMCARELAKDRVKTAVIESNNFLGGGFWIGGFLMNIVTFRSPSEKILDELSIPYEEPTKGLFTADAPTACSKLIAAACDAGAKIFNMTRFEDVIYRNGKVCGVVINASPVAALPRAISCLDPVCFEAKVVIDGTGHDAKVVQSLKGRNILESKTYGPMDVIASEDGVVEKTCEVLPGLIVTGMAVSTMFGLPRMGPTFGSMLVSGKKAAELAKSAILQEAVSK
ncbi:sulfide-dependent adenosine diphosphate thiazole synthase [Candidatus Omnitrophota bacterium]